MKNKLIKSVFFQTSGSILTVIIRLITTMILARILKPEDFGKFALLMIIYGIGTQIAALNSTQVLLTRKFLSKKFLNSAFYYNLALNICIFLFIFLFSEKIALFLGNNQLSFEIKLVAILFPFGSVSYIHNVLLMKQMDYHKLSLINVLTTIIESTIALLLVIFFNYNYSALIYAFFFSIIFKNIITVFFIKWIPKIEISLTIVYFLFKNGIYLFLENLMIYLKQNTDSLFIAKFLNYNILGYYNFAYKLPNLILTRIIAPSMSVYIPSLTTINRDKELIIYLTQTIKHIIYVSMLIFLIVFILSKEFILIMWGEKWVESSWMMKFLIVSIIINLYSFPFGGILIKKNKMIFLLYSSALKLILTIIFVYFSLLNFGLKGMLYAIIIIAIISFFINLFFLKKTFPEIKLKLFIIEISKPIFLAIIVVILNIILKSILIKVFNDYICIVFIIIFITTSYLFILKLLDNSFFIFYKNLLIKIIRKLR
ncbi:hypothetical protein FE773_01785 [Caminibacter mediatlanticus TB-2]|uniref:Lipopolysaccharide biosynthesis protein n=1 Tax=Caminibacter mediatlanticus TB-2 TaxID=391592 RepID=A0ABX5V6T0_9BACT|nr:oligosaccharide flippase family protein [Caminibacter mediatlanticus]QCT93953.1 hypothetical protein FE773_01785 [Caminibacter mediatlanticus TB-2]